MRAWVVEMYSVLFQLSSERKSHCFVSQRFKDPEGTIVVEWDGCSLFPLTVFHQKTRVEENPTKPRMFTHILALEVTTLPPEVKTWVLVPTLIDATTQFSNTTVALHRTRPTNITLFIVAVVLSRFVGGVWVESFLFCVRNKTPNKRSIDCYGQRIRVMPRVDRSRCLVIFPAFCGLVRDALQWYILSEINHCQGGSHLIGRKL